MAFIVYSNPFEESSLTSKTIVLAIVGYRNFTDKKVFDTELAKWIKANAVPDKIISGGATGVDTLAKNYATTSKIPFVEFEAKWRTDLGKYDRSAGPKRNTKIVKECTHMLAFPSPKGSGTQDSIKKAKKAKKHLTVFEI
jgi:hypothetical protein